MFLYTTIDFTGYTCNCVVCKRSQIELSQTTMVVYASAHHYHKRA